MKPDKSHILYDSISDEISRTGKSVETDDWLPGALGWGWWVGSSV